MPFINFVGLRPRREVELEFQGVSRGLIPRIQHGLNYAYEIDRVSDSYPTFESFYVCTPATMPSKTRSGFDRFDEKWNRLNPAHQTESFGVKRALQLPLIAA